VTAVDRLARFVYGIPIASSSVWPEQQPRDEHTAPQLLWGTRVGRGRREFGELKAYEHFSSRDVWGRDVQVWQVLGQPRGGGAT
jgi:hypothetical protein